MIAALAAGLPDDTTKVGGAGSSLRPVLHGDPLGQVLAEAMLGTPAEASTGADTGAASGFGRLSAGLLAERLSPGLAVAFAGRPGARGVMLYPDLDQMLALCLPASGDAALGLAQWIEMGEALLALWGRHRRQLALIPASDPLPDLLARVRTWLGTGTPGSRVQAAPVTANPVSGPEADPSPPEARLVAAVLMQTQRAARDMHGHLEAASPPRVAEGSPTGYTLQAVLAEVAAARDQAVVQNDRQHALVLRRYEMRAETEAQTARRQADALAERIATLEARLAAAVAAGAAAADQAARHQAATAEAVHRAETLQDRNTTLEGALAEAARDHAAASAAAAAAASGLALQAAEIAGLREDLEGALAEAARDHAAASAAAAAAASGLALQAAEIAGLREDLEAAIRDGAAGMADIGRLARDIALRDGRIRLLAEALQRAEDEADALRASHSWRVTAPLRALSQAARRLKP